MSADSKVVSRIYEIYGQFDNKPFSVDVQIPANDDYMMTKFIE